MLNNLKRAKIKVIIEDKKMELPKEIRKNIEKHWEKAIEKTPNMWNGEITCVGDCEFEENEIVISCVKSDYAHYLYDERIGLPKEYACSNLSAGCLIETSDNYYIVGELAEDTSFPRCMQIPGGNADNSDIIDGEINIFNTIIRECKEEINIDLQDNEQVQQCEIKYIELPSENLHRYMIFAKGKIKMTSTQMRKYYDEYVKSLKENNLEIEFGKIHFIKKGKTNEYLDKVDNPQREYLRNLLEEDSKN